MKGAYSLLSNYITQTTVHKMRKITNQRNDSIDIIKGFLIILVIIGHILLGTLDENIIRFVIYSFHMPLFMFMSGYMINISKLSSLSFQKTFVKYWDRMLKIWFIAFATFSLYQLIGSFTFRHVLRLIYSPWYHLWYVPTLFCYICIARFLFAKTNKVATYSILFGLYIVWTIVKIQLNPMPIPRWCDFTQIPYFALGIYFKNHFNGHCFNTSYRLIPLIFIPVILFTKAMPIQAYNIISTILLILVITLYLYPSITNDSLPKSKVLSYVGKHSLSIYLWHMIFIEPFKDYVSNTTIYYSITLTIFFTFFFLIKLQFIREQ